MFSSKTLIWVLLEDCIEKVNFVMTRNDYTNSCFLSWYKIESHFFCVSDSRIKGEDVSSSLHCQSLPAGHATPTAGSGENYLFALFLVCLFFLAYKKIMTDFAHFPCPGENYPYVVQFAPIYTCGAIGQQQMSLHPIWCLSERLLFYQVSLWVCSFRSI